jgi:tetracycline repressor-like protein
LEGDLRGLVREVLDTFTDPAAGAGSAASISASFHSDRAAEALRSIFARRHERSAEVVTRAVRRGELAEETDAGAVVRAAVAPLYYRLFLSREPIDDATAEQGVAAAVAAAHAAVFSGGSRRRRARPVRLP